MARHSTIAGTAWGMPDLDDWFQRQDPEVDETIIYLSSSISSIPDRTFSVFWKTCHILDAFKAPLQMFFDETYDNHIVNLRNGTSSSPSIPTFDVLREGQGQTSPREMPPRETHDGQIGLSPSIRGCQRAASGMTLEDLSNRASPSRKSKMIVMESLSQMRTFWDEFLHAYQQCFLDFHRYQRTEH